ncbi:hypothetical protein SDC9_199322 [bioreactor metagenome]|uniref:ComG operon protein 3 n=1 Tax=bioreactor metagenome TaxID=1076179 RepID=A0A645IWV9_9ZZZZ|nr:competence type IV pilus major pilin ComGC [Erysipelotrichaceae bacterium]
MRKGFTLLEMVVVLMVIGAIFLLTIPNINKVIVMINEKGCENQLKIVDTAIIEYQILHDEDPASVDELVMEGLLTEKQLKCRNGKIIEIEDGQAAAY